MAVLARTSGLLALLALTLTPGEAAAQRQFNPLFERAPGGPTAEIIVFSRPAGHELRLDLFAPEKGGPGPRRTGSPVANLHRRASVIALPPIAPWRFSADDPTEGDETSGFFERVTPLVVGSAVAGAVLYLMFEGLCFGNCSNPN